MQGTGFFHLLWWIWFETSCDWIKIRCRHADLIKSEYICLENIFIVQLQKKNKLPPFYVHKEIQTLHSEILGNQQFHERPTFRCRPAVRHCHHFRRIGVQLSLFLPKLADILSAVSYFGWNSLEVCFCPGTPECRVYTITNTKYKHPQFSLKNGGDIATITMILLFLYSR